jgi:AraC family transcriptional regulator of adaptative response/methylated-DNA-[protein]-cysteine methyltransferase
MRVVLLVLVLVQGEARCGLVAVDQAGIRHEACEACLLGCFACQAPEDLRHSGPCRAALRIVAVVAIARAVGDPADASAIGHRHRHLKAARCRHAAERCLGGDGIDRRHQCRIDGQRAAAQQHRAVAQHLPGLEVEQVRHHGFNRAIRMRIPVRCRSVETNGVAYVAGPTMEKIMTDTIRHAAAESSLGRFVAALSDRGLAMVEFGDMSEADLKVRFPDAVLIEDTAALQETLGKLIDLIEHPDRDVELALDLRGSAFELDVWQALRQVPAGSTVTYGELAARLGVPRQAREVGEACAANKLAVVVPCHRVVKKDGSIAGYRWGFTRKRTLLEREHRAALLRPSAVVPHEATTA